MAFERMVAEPGQQVADAGHAGAGHLGILGLVGDFVEPAGMEAAIEADTPRPARLLWPDEGPILARDRLAGIVGMPAPGQHRVGVVDDDRLVGQAVDAGICRRLHRRGDGEFIGDLAPDRAAVGHPRHRRREDQRLDAGRFGRHVPGPGREEQRKAVPHQETVAGIGLGGRVVVGRRFAVDLAENGDAAAIVDVVEQGRWLDADRAQQDELAVEHDFAAIVARRQLQIGDGLVGRQHRIERVMRDAADLLVGSCFAERLALREGDAFEYLHPLHRREGGGGGEEEGGGSRSRFTRRAPQGPHRPCPRSRPWSRPAAGCRRCACRNPARS